MDEGVVGRIHSVETFGAVDGPGVRYVVFFQGCLMKCIYCHNPDSWSFFDGKEISSKEVVSDIIPYKNYIKRGGVTLSGGEPLCQPDFAIDIIKRCRRSGLHTAIDTSGAVALEISHTTIEAADMLLLDIKSYDELLFTKITGRNISNTIRTLEFCEKIKKPVWIRHVMVPGYTLNKVLLENLADYLKNFTCVEKVELLPFHKMGEFKWTAMDKNYRLYDTTVPTKEEIDMADEIFLSRGLNL